MRGSVAGTSTKYARLAPACNPYPSRLPELFSETSGLVSVIPAVNNIRAFCVLPRGPMSFAAPHKAHYTFRSKQIS